MPVEWIGRWAGGRIRPGRGGGKVWVIERMVDGKRHAISLAAKNEVEALEALRLFQIKHGLPVTAMTLPEPRGLIQERGLIYFVRAGGAVKIGFTTGVEKRLAQLRSGASEGLFLLGLLPALVAYQTLRWRSRQRLAGLERALADLRAVASAEPVADTATPCLPLLADPKA